MESAGLSLGFAATGFRKCLFLLCVKAQDLGQGWAWVLRAQHAALDARPLAVSPMCDLGYAGLLLPWFPYPLG